MNVAQVLFEVGWSLRLDKEALSGYFEIDGAVHLKKAHEKGRGILVLTAHFGNWELLTVSAALSGYLLGILYRPLDSILLNRFFVNLRTRFGAKVIPQKRALREILRGLGRGEIVALLMDQNVDWYEGVFADFMGRRACTNKGLALIALKSEAPVVPVFMIRRRNGFTARVLPEIPLIKTGDKTRDIEENTAQYNKAIEFIVRQHPEQWFWLHQRWKTRPHHPWPREIDHGNSID